jgi:flagellar motor switch/type III secretory pathway protein FliN
MSYGVPGEVQPWLLLGARRRRSLENRVGAAAERWAAHWIASTVTLSVAVERATDAVQQPTRFAARRQGDWLAQIAVPSHLVAWAAGLGAVEFSATTDFDQVSFSGEIELELMRGFWGMLVPQALAEETPLERCDESPAPPKRGVSVSCDFGAAPGFNIQLTLSPIMFATLLAEQRPGYVGESLTSRRSAFAQAPVALDCCLGAVQVPVRELHSLRIGDVLVTDIALDGHAELRVRHKPRPIAAGTLGAVAGRKALKVESAQVVTANRGLRR